MNPRVLKAETGRRLKQHQARGPEKLGLRRPDVQARLVCWVRVTEAPPVTYEWWETGENDPPDTSGDCAGVVCNRMAVTDEWEDVSEDVRLCSIAGPLTVGQRYLAIRTGSLQIYGGGEGTEGWPRFLVLAPADEVDGDPYEGIVSNQNQTWQGDKKIRGQIIAKPSEASNHASITLDPSSGGGTYAYLTLVSASGSNSMVSIETDTYYAKLITSSTYAKLTLFGKEFEVGSYEPDFVQCPQLMSGAFVCKSSGNFGVQASYGSYVWGRTFYGLTIVTGVNLNPDGTVASVDTGTLDFDHGLLISPPP